MSPRPPRSRHAPPMEPGEWVWRGTARSDRPVHVADLVAELAPKWAPLLARLPEPPRPAKNRLHYWRDPCYPPETIEVQDVHGPSWWRISEEPWTEEGLIYKTAGGELVKVVERVGDDALGVLRGAEGSRIGEVRRGDVLRLIPPPRVAGRASERRSNAVVEIARWRYRKKAPHLLLGEMLGRLERIVIRGSRDVFCMRPVRGWSDAAGRHPPPLVGLMEQVTAEKVDDPDPRRAVIRMLERCRAEGARDLDVLLVSAHWKDELQHDGAVHGDRWWAGGLFPGMVVIPTPWLPRRAAMALARGRVLVVPLEEKSFRLWRSVSSRNQMVGGEYTLVTHYPECMGMVTAK